MTLHTPSPECLWVYRARLARVVDGDTVRLLLDLGLFVHTTQAIRVRDLEAPEIFSGTDETKAAGQAAKTFVEEWFASHDDGSPWPFLVRTHKDRQSFNRYVADITTADGTRDLATDVVSAGHGAWR